MFTKHTCDFEEPKNHENMIFGQERLHDLAAFRHIEVLLLRLAVDNRLTARLNAIRDLTKHRRRAHTAHSIPASGFFPFAHV